MERLRRDLPTIAEATDGLYTPAHRRRLANGFVDILIKYRVCWYDRYDEDYVPQLRALRASSVLPMHELRPRNHEELGPRLQVTENIIASWLLDEVAPEVVLEELHTAAELLLKGRNGHGVSLQVPRSSQGRSREGPPEE